MDKVTSGLEKLATEIEYLDELHSIFGELERKRYQEMEDIINAELNKRMMEGWSEQELKEKRDQMREELSTVARTAIEKDYEQLAKSSPRTQILLQDMFEEILQFLMGVFRIFYHPDGSECIPTADGEHLIKFTRVEKRDASCRQNGLAPVSL